MRISDWSSDVCSSDLLAGEHDVAATTRHLSDFADTACDLALAAAFAERVPGEDARGIAVVAPGPLGTHDLNYSSDIDPILIFAPDPPPPPSTPRHDDAPVPPPSRGARTPAPPPT